MGPKVLVVDDEADVRQILLLVLERVCDASEASNGFDALRLIKSERPSLVLLDVAMPEIDGLEVLRTARLIDPELVVVMLTGESDLAVAQRALESGARSYMTKPFEAKTLRDEIQRLLEDLAAPRAPYRPWRMPVC